MYGIGFILIKKLWKRDQVTKILITHQEKKRQVLCKLFTKIIIFELYVILTNMYCLFCIMQRHKMTKLDKILSNLRAKEHRSLMEKFHKDELGE